jgi:hypothetical protein
MRSFPQLHTSPLQEKILSNISTNSKMMYVLKTFALKIFLKVHFIGFIYHYGHSYLVMIIPFKAALFSLNIIIYFAIRPLFTRHPCRSFYIRHYGLQTMKLSSIEVATERGFPRSHPSKH